MAEGESGGAVAFALIYLTFFLDNVLLTVLVPIIPDWLREDSVELWARHDAPLATLLNDTVRRSAAGAEPHGDGAGVSQWTVGVVLGCKAGAQLAAAPAAGAAVARRGPAAVLRAATALLAAAALVFAGVSGWGGRRAAWAVCCGRAAHGAGAAGAAVAGLALAARAVSARRRRPALAALLGAVALGVLVGYPFGGITYALWSRGTSFLFIAAALLANLAMQFMFLNKPEYNMPSPSSAAGGVCGLRSAARGAAGACAGGVLLTTAAMAALEPCLPLWIMDHFHPKKWALGVVFVADSLGYVAGTALAGAALGPARLAPEPAALLGQAAVGLAALALPYARSVAALGAPQLVLGAGLGALDGALVPALGARDPHRLHLLAALLQAASSAAYAIGPVVGGAMSWLVGFESTMRALGVLNLLYVAYLYRALRRNPLSEQWGAGTPEDTSEDISEVKGSELTPLRPETYSTLHSSY